VQAPIRRVDGYWELPTAPGLGVEVDEKVAAKHPFEQQQIASLEAVINRDGAIANW
jgi:galactonate dehydratase